MCEKFFFIKIIDNVLLRTLYWSILPRFLVNGATWCVLEHILRELSLKKIYISLNNIDMLLLRTSYRYGVFLKYFFNFKLVRIEVYMVKLCHEKMLILRCIIPPKNRTFSRKKNLTSHPLENLEHPDKKTQLTGNNFNPLKKP